MNNFQTVSNIYIVRLFRILKTKTPKLTYAIENKTEMKNDKKNFCDTGLQS